MYPLLAHVWQRETETFPGAWGMEMVLRQADRLPLHKYLHLNRDDRFSYKFAAGIAPVFAHPAHGTFVIALAFYFEPVDPAHESTAPGQWLAIHVSVMARISPVDAFSRRTRGMRPLSAAPCLEGAGWGGMKTGRMSAAVVAYRPG